MTLRSTDAVIEDLRRDLRPVRPIPRLRLVIAIAAALAGAAAIGLYSWVGPRTDLARLLVATPSFTGIAVGLVLVAAGAALSVAGSSVPGRERVAKWGRALALVGGTLALAIAPLWMVLAGHGHARMPAASDIGCLIESVLAGFLPALWLFVFTRWAAPQRRALAGAVAIAAGAAAGALTIHAICPAPDAWHGFLGHALAPLLAAALALPTLALARRKRH